MEERTGSKVPGTISTFILERMQLNRWFKKKKKGRLKLWGSQRRWIAGKQSVSRTGKITQRRDDGGGGRTHGQDNTHSYKQLQLPTHLPVSLPMLLLKSWSSQMQSHAYIKKKTNKLIINSHQFCLQLHIDIRVYDFLVLPLNLQKHYFLYSVTTTTMIIKCQKYCLAILGIKECCNNKANSPPQQEASEMLQCRVSILLRIEDKAALNVFKEISRRIFTKK